MKSTVFKLLGERKASEAENLRQVHTLVAEVAPDGVLIWGMWNMPRAVPAEFERALPEKTAYYLCDYWPSLPDFIPALGRASQTQTGADWQKCAGSIFSTRRAKIEAPVNRLLLVSDNDAVRSLLVIRGNVVTASNRGDTRIAKFLPGRGVVQRSTGSSARVDRVWLKRTKKVHTAILPLAPSSPDGVG